MPPIGASDGCTLWSDVPVELRELRAFVAVVEEGGVSAAARRLHLSQPALSQTVRALERELGVELLVRTSTGTSPTPAGRTLLDEATAVLARVDRLRAALTVHVAPGGGVLRLGVPLELPGGLLPAALRQFGAQWPHVRVQAAHASTAAQLAALAAAELDVALVRELPAGEDADASLMLEEPLGVLLATHHPATAHLTVVDVGVRLETLSGSDWVGFAREDGAAWWDEVVAVLRRHGHRPPAPAAAAPLIAEVKLAAVAAGGSFALAPRGWGQPLPDAVQWHPLTGHPLVRRTWSVWPAASTRRDLAALVASFDAAAAL